MKIIALIALLLFGCGVESIVDIDHIYLDEKTDYFEGIDEEILPYYAKFATIYSADVGNIPANFVKLKGTTAGVCISYGDGSKEVRIDLRKWDGLSDTSKEILIFHELGHCYLDRGHDESHMDTEDFGEIPQSIMYPYVLQDSWYESFMDHYIEELGQ